MYYQKATEGGREKDLSSAVSYPRRPTVARAGPSLSQELDTQPTAPT